MTNKEAVNWLISLTADIGKSEHHDLWHYEQALYEIKEMLEGKDTMSSADCISRQAVLKLLHALPPEEAMTKALLIKGVKQMDAAQPEQHWIPCSERLPDGAYPVIVTWENTDPASYYQYILGKHYVGVAHYKNGKWYWYSSVTEDVLMEYGRYDSEEFDEAIECIAWMPLPAPAKIEG